MYAEAQQLARVWCRGQNPHLVDGSLFYDGGRRQAVQERHDFGVGAAVSLQARLLCQTHVPVVPRVRRSGSSSASDRRRHGLLHRADLVVALACQFKGRTGHTGNLGFGVTLGVDAHALVAFHENPARFAEIHARGQLAHDHDIQARHDFFFQRRKVGQSVKALRGAQVGKQVHLFAQPQQAALGLDREIELVIFRPAYSAQQNAVHLLRLGHGGVGQRRAMRILSATAHQIFGHIKFDPALGIKPRDDLFNFAHNFGADAVTGKDED